MSKGWGVVLLAAVSMAVLIGAAQAASPVTERLNVNYLNGQANGGGWAPSLSAEGRYLAIHSWATNLLPSGNPSGYNVYVRDLTLKVNYLVSAGSGTLANGESLYPAISANGQTVAFASVASNLVAGDTNGVSDAFVRDWATGQVERASVATSGEQGNGPSSDCAICGVGRYVVFRSEATNLIPGGNPMMGVYVRDRVNRTTQCVSISTAGALASQISYYPSITPNGRYITFISYAGNLVSGDTNGVADVFLRDRVAGTTERISISSAGVQGNGGCNGSRPAITPDGRYVVFTSLANNLVPNDYNGNWDVFVRDRVAGTTERISVSSSGGEAYGNSGADSYKFAINADGRYVEFASAASNLVPGDTNGQWDAFLRDRVLGTTERLSVSTTGVEANNASGYYGLAISDDGNFRVFDTHAHNLTPGDTMWCIDTYARYVPGGSPPPVGTAPVAGFNGTPTSGNAPLTVFFTDTSTGAPTSWAWSFGDGGASNAQHPSHVYSGAGSYTVGLTAANSAGSNTNQKSQYIVVTTNSGGHTVAATAAASPSSVNSGGTVACSATGTDSQGHGGLAWSWSDGGAGGAFSPSASVQNPTYSAPTNTSGQPLAVTLTVSAICKWQWPWVTGTASTAITVVGGVPAHTVTVSLTLPASVPSGGLLTPTASATDSQSYSITAWSWSDGGAGGAFSPSATAAAPSYRAPVNSSGSTRTVTITVTAATADGTHGSATAMLQVTSTSGHQVSASASGTPSTVASRGTVSLSATGVCSQGHTGLAWSWSDGGAGGAFSPSASVQNPTYTTPPNSTGQPLTVTLTVSAICKWQWPWITGTASTTVTVTSGGASTHTVTASLSLPVSVPSGGLLTPTASATDSGGYSIAAWSWSDGGAGGTFSPSAAAPAPSYYAPVNSSGSTRTVTLTVTAATADGTHGSASATVQVTSSSHQVTVSASATPGTIASGGTASLSATATCSQGHTGLAWNWSDNGAGGTFVPSANVQNPTYVASPNTTGSPRTITLTVLATCKWFWPWTAKSATTSLVETAAP